MGRILTPDDYKTLTFDCYGTLIDWESGLLAYLQPVLERHDVHVNDEFVLELFGALEPEVQANGGRYAEVLREVLRRIGRQLAFRPDEDTLNGFPASIREWRPYPDTVAALRRLKSRYELAVVSNIDEDLFAASQQALGVTFDHVVTAERVGAYKPDRRMFDTLLAEVEAPVLHVAQSLFHDIAPARALGIDTAWINRGGPSAARAADVTPDWTFSSLADLAEALS